MIKKQALLGILILCLTTKISKAQSDSSSMRSQFVQYAGVQLNPLLRQIINFNNSNQTTVNPYLLTYSIDDKKTGSGIRIGAGLNYTATTTDDGVTKNVTNEIDYELRLGYEKLIRIGNRWELTAGIDLLLNNTNNFTNTVENGPQTLTTNITDENFNYGIGPMVSLRFYATRRILIGTETSLYYTRGFPTETISEYQSNPGGGPPFYVTSKTSSFSAQATLALPVAFYLIVKF